MGKNGLRLVITFGRKLTVCDKRGVANRLPGKTAFALFPKYFSALKITMIVKKYNNLATLRQMGQ
jgi:hypothetical protein